MSNADRAFELTRDLIIAHDLPVVTVKLNSRLKRSLGRVRYRRRPDGPARPFAIEYSAEYVRDATWEEVEDTVRHEVAHLIAGFEAGHGPAWQRACRVTGARPKRCKDNKGYQPGYKWSATCCGQTFGRHRLTRRLRYGARCPKCKSSLTWRG